MQRYVHALTLLAVMLVSAPVPAADAPPGEARAPAAGDAATKPAPARAVIVIFDFASPDDAGTRGKKLADALRLRAARLDTLTLIDPFSMSDTLGPGDAPTMDTPPETVARLLRDRFAAEVGLWGRVTRAADGSYTIEAVGVDLREGAPRAVLRKTYAAAQPQLVNARCDEILTDLTGFEKTNRPKEADPAAAARAKVLPRNLVVNGDFEAAGEQPRGWEKVNNLTLFLEPGDKEHGRVLRIDSDVYEAEAKGWAERLKAGAPLAEAPKKTPTRGPKYDTVAGNYGVHNYSDAIAVTPGKTYRLEINYRGKTDDFFFPKLFFRGWAEVAGEDRIVTDGYLSLRSMEQTGRWKRNQRLFTVPRPEELGGRTVKYVRLMIYAYWPPGQYWFDNVGLYEVVAGPDGKPVEEKPADR